jgi:hypothetical protein
VGGQAATVTRVVSVSLLPPTDEPPEPRGGVFVKKLQHLRVDASLCFIRADGDETFRQII